VGLIDELDYHPKDPNAVQRSMQRIAGSRPGAWLFSKTLHHVDKPLLRLSRGRLTVPSLTSGLPVITLTTTGAKTGKRRTMPLVGVPAGDDIAVVGTNFGQRSTPAWWFNLRAHPAGEVTYRGRTVAVHARETRGKERDAIVDRARGIYSGYERYEGRISGREIHVMVLQAAPADR